MTLLSNFSLYRRFIIDFDSYVNQGNVKSRSGRDQKATGSGSGDCARDLL